MNRGFIHGPVHTISDIERLARFRQFFRVPEGHDVVVGFVGGRNLDQVDGALAPVTLRLDPGAWALLVVVVEVFVVAEGALALHQAETTRVLDAEVAHGQVFRVVQRAPQPLAVAGMDRQAFGVVQGRAVVEDLGRLVGAEQVHAGQRGNAQAADMVTQEHAGLHVDHGVVAWAQDQLVGTGGAWRVQQGVDDQVLVGRLGLLDPELGEAREFLARRQCGVDGQATGRQAVHVALADHAEIAGAKQGHDLVLLVGLVDRVQHAETGVTQVLGGFRVVWHVTELETVRVVLDFLDLGGGDLVDLHRGVEVHALVIERQLERGLVLGPLGLFLQEMNLLVVRELHVAEYGRQVAFRCFVLLAGQILCLGCNIVKIECPQLARAHQADQCHTGHQGLAQPGTGDS
ncbi:hypothetical protein D3C72_1083570 [compost metagenome]